MDDNLYAPPKSRVLDVEPLSTGTTPSAPPRAVKISIVTTCLSFVVGLAGRLIGGEWGVLKNVTLGAGFAVGASIVVAIGYFWLLMLYRGRNWARWLWMANFVLGLALMRYSLSRLSSAWERELYLVQCAVQVFATFLLFLPSSNKWFTRHRKV